MRLLTILLTSAAAIRFALAIRGGQYFDWDEHRYGFATLMLERLRLGDGGGALDIMFRYPDHPGFKIAGLVPAALQQMLHPAQTISDMRQPSGEWRGRLRLLSELGCRDRRDLRARPPRRRLRAREHVRRVPDVRVDDDAHARPPFLALRSGAPSRAHRAVGGAQPFRPLDRQHRRRDPCRCGVLDVLRRLVAWWCGARRARAVAPGVVRPAAQARDPLGAGVHGLADRAGRGQRPAESAACVGRPRLCGQSHPR